MMGKEMKNIILIGMPGAGKSTVGVVLAKRIGYQFLDSDILIQKDKGKLLHELIREFGTDGFLEIENEVNTRVDVKQTVLATGGSAVYGKQAMEHLKQIGTVVYLRVDLKGIARRLGNLNERGVVLRKGQTLADLYCERVPLYEKYADITIKCDNKMIRDIVTEICIAVGKD